MRAHADGARLHLVLLLDGIGLGRLLGSEVLRIRVDVTENAVVSARSWCTAPSRAWLLDGTGLGRLLGSE